MMNLRLLEAPSPALLASFVFGLFFSSMGCGSSQRTVPVAGKIVFEDGSPVRAGTIETKPIQQDHVEMQATGNIEEDGRFVLGTFGEKDGAIPGRHRCVVIQFFSMGDNPGHRGTSIGLVNPEYRSYQTSDLVVEIPPKGTSELKIVVRGYSTAGTEEHHHDDLEGGKQ